MRGGRNAKDISATEYKAAASAENSVSHADGTFNLRKSKMIGGANGESSAKFGSSCGMFQPAHFLIA
jgi:hypothetical protein